MASNNFDDGNILSTCNFVFNLIVFAISTVKYRIKFVLFLFLHQHICRTAILMNLILATYHSANRWLVENEAYQMMQMSLL